MGYYKRYNCRKGVALIIILLFVAVVTVVGLGFIVRGDTELLYGRNMAIKADMDYIAESGLEHARGLILNPQDVPADWAGVTGAQINPGSDDYYDVSVTQLSPFNYRLTSFGYRQEGGEVTARESLTAELRLNPCIVYWQSAKEDFTEAIVINGDIYIGDNIINMGSIFGDVYSAKQLGAPSPGYIEGQVYGNLSAPPISLPGISQDDFKLSYYIGTTSYSVGQIAPGTQTGITLAPSATNPAGVYYCDGSLDIEGDSFINGTLVVKDDLKIKSTGVLTIQSVKNFPALIVGHDLRTEDENTVLSATGYVQIEHHIDMKNKEGCLILIDGALYIFGDGIKNASVGSLEVNGMPHKASLAIWSGTGQLTRWSPAVGAFYKSVTRNP